MKILKRDNCGEMKNVGENRVAGIFFSKKKKKNNNGQKNDLNLALPKFNFFFIIYIYIIFFF